VPDYKLPKCWIGHPITIHGGALVGEHTDGTRVITQEDCNPACHCSTPMQAFFCMEGHMLECHAGMNCAEARCAHYIQQMENEKYENY
jgi:hypothetical protein